MENSRTFEPVVWRLLIFRLIPFLIGWVGFDLIYKLYKHLPITLSSLLLSNVGALIGAVIGFLLVRKKFTIELSNGNISGPGGNVILTKEKFPVIDLEIPNFSKQSFYEKISGFYSIRSRNGQRIMFTPIIYGKETKEKIYKAIMQTLADEN